MRSSLPTLTAIAAMASSMTACRANPPAPRAPTVITAGSVTSPPLRVDDRVGDAEITQAALRRIQRDPALAGAVVRVQTTNGIVELTGTTQNIVAKERAAKHAELLRGVRAVSNRLVVEPAAIDDASLGRDVRAALSRELGDDAASLEVVAKGGAVTLRGSMRSIAGKHLATSVAESVRGVAEVQNDADVVAGAPRSDANVATEVGARLKWDVMVDDALVTATVSKGEVRLGGVVSSAAEKRRAIEDAWVAGVDRVDASGLRIEPWLHRSDRHRAQPARADVERAIVDAMRRDPRLDATKITVSVDGRTATLRGNVTSLAIARAAERVARDTVGVTAVANLLTVSPLAPREDAAIARDATAALESDAFIGGTGVEARVHDGSAVLTGTVASVFAKAEAESAVAAVPGVRTIDNRLSVRNPSLVFASDSSLTQLGRSAAVALPPPLLPTKSDPQIATDLALEIGWSPYLDPATIQTRVRGGRAILTGTVPTWRAWFAAYNAAFDAGAVAVDNQLTVK